MILTKRKIIIPLLMWLIQLASWAGEINLKAIDAKIHGTGATYESQENRQCIGHWSDVKTWISWDVDITTPGEVEVYLSQAIPYEFAGSSYEIHVGDKILKGRIAIGSDWGDFDEIKVGSVNLTQKGKFNVKLKPIKMATKRAFANIRGIILRGGGKLGQLHKTPPVKYVPISTETSGLITSDCAIFYPKGYDKSKHSKSFALINEPQITDKLPNNWQLQPQFHRSKEGSRFTLQVEKGTSLYGTGEVMGRLERKGTKTTLWNTDNFCYSKDGGKRLYQSHPWIMGVRKDG